MFMFLTTIVKHDKKPTLDFNYLYDKYYLTFWKKAYKSIRDEHHSEEVVTDVFMKLYDDLSTFEDETSVAKWLHVVTDRTIADFFRKNKSYHKRIVITPDDDTTFTTAEDSTFDKPLDHLLKQEAAKEVNKIVRTLKPKHFEVIELHYYKDMSVKQIAEMLKVSIYTIYSRLSKAEAVIKNEMKHYNGTGGKNNV